MNLQIGDGTTWTDLTPSGLGMRLISFDQVAARGNEDVTETATLHAVTSNALAEPAILAAQQWFELARQRRSDVSRPHVYIRQKNNNDSDWYRANVLDGSVQSDTTTRMALGGISQWSITWVREATLYAETETTVAASTTLQNTYAGGSVNILNVGQINSAVDTPIRLAITSNNAASLGSVWMGLYRSRTAIVAATLGAATTLEAESGTVLAGTGTSTAQALASGGFYRAFAWGPSTETELWSYSLTNASLQYLMGKSWRIFARVYGAPGNVTRMRVKLKYSTLAIATTELVPVSGAALLELPAITLPPYEANGATLSALDLVVSAIGTGTNTLNLDCLHLMPVDSFRTYQAAGAGGYIANTEVINDKPNVPVVHISTSGGVARATVAALGAPIKGGSGDYHALHILMKDSTGASAIALNASVAAYAQLRRRTAI